MAPPSPSRCKTPVSRYWCPASSGFPLRPVRSPGRPRYSSRPQSVCRAGSVPVLSATATSVPASSATDIHLITLTAFLPSALSSDCECGAHQPVDISRRSLRTTSQNVGDVALFRRRAEGTKTRNEVSETNGMDALLAVPTRKQNGHRTLVG